MILFEVAANGVALRMHEAMLLDSEVFINANPRPTLSHHAMNHSRAFDLFIYAEGLPKCNLQYMRHNGCATSDCCMLSIAA